MKTTLDRRLMYLLFIVIIGGLVEIYYGLLTTWDAIDTHLDERSILSPNYIINTTGCRIPEYNPFSTSLRFYYGSQTKYDCNVKVTYTTQEGSLLKIDPKLKDFADFSHCTYEGIYRKNGSENSVVFGRPVRFNNDTHVTEQQVRVKCYDVNEHELYRNFHAFVLPNLKRVKELDRKLKKHKANNSLKETLNVWMVGIDSLSRFNHIRNMPKTRSYLINDLAAYDLQGYTKVADNTFVNTMPILVGRFVEEELSRLNLRLSKSNFVDDFDLIWKNFSLAGYSTLFGEDHPVIGLFTCYMGGFKKMPTDHYLRRITVAMEEDPRIWNSYHNCIHNRSETSFILDYGLDFFRAYKDRPRFAYNFITRLTHDYASTYARTADDYYHEFLTKAHREGLLNNTVLFFFGDHGSRFGPAMKKFISKFEERTPLMNVVFPRDFHRKYPEIMNNLKDNLRKLTSNFDIYETLKDILYFTGKPKNNVNIEKQRGISLFEEIPGRRTCRNAGISEHWCVCQYEEDKILKIDQNIKLRGANTFISDLNKNLLEYEECSKLELGEITKFQVFKPGDHNTTERIVRFSIVLDPGSAEFDVSLFYDNENDELSFKGDFSRTNSYGKNGDCVQGKSIQSYCYCKQGFSFF